MKNYLWILWILIIVTLGAGLTWYADQEGLIPDELFSITRPSVAKHRLFVPNNNAGLSQDMARTVYQQALQLKAEDRNEEALAEFEKLKDVYPGLGDIILLHIATLHQELGREFSVQTNLKEAIKRYSDSPLMPQIHYELGLSHYRGNEAEKAEALFRQLIKEYPDSDYGLASHYFLANLIQRQETPDNETAIQQLSTYLKECPDCIYSADSALQLEKLLETPTQEQHKLIGEALAHSNQNSKKSLEHLKQAPVETVWKMLAKSLIAEKKFSEANRILTKGLPLAENMDDVRWAVDKILETGSGGRSAKLKALNEQNIPLGGDYILWKLAVSNPSNSDYYYQEVLSRYPQGDYAPESSWSLLWPMLKNSRHNEFLVKGEDHVKNYPYARSTPKILFWLGKIQEKKANKSSAIIYYQRLVDNYPDDYYAFRGSKRLIELNGGKDTGWQTLPDRTDYPPENAAPNDNLIAITGVTDPWEIERLKELFNAKASEDLIDLTKTITGKVPAALESWYHHQTGNRARGIRIIRDDIYERYKPTPSNPVSAYAFPNISDEERKLLYPLYFTEYIAEFANKNNVDPFIAQSLMREESYYNEFAVSSSDARGLMQLLPATAREVAGWEKMTGFQTIRLFQPEVNIQLGTRYLNHINAYLGDNHMLMVGAYNGGPNAMKRWSSASAYMLTDPDMFVERIPYEQTRDYIKKVFGSYWNYTRLYGNS